jgi:peptidyl-prolyl cis-trans isomerase B (cyclophilin B)
VGVVALLGGTVSATQFGADASSAAPLSKTNAETDAKPKPAPKPAPKASQAPKNESVPKKVSESSVPSKRKGSTVQVVIKSNKGDIKLELDKDKAPLTVENFLDYVNSNHFDGTIFHRVIGGFMIQGGGFDAEMKQKPVRKPIAIESSNGLKNARGTVAMARTNDPNSATAQFFINLSDNDFLNYESDGKPGYAVFGKVVEGMDVVDEIAKVRTGNKGMHADVPLQAVTLDKVTLAE